MEAPPDAHLLESTTYRTSARGSVIPSTGRSAASATTRSTARSAALTEDVVASDATSDTPYRNHTFNGYAPSGNVSGEAVYANYGRPEDFDVLAAAGVDVAGKVVITRYGQCFRGLKAMNAEARGAVATIIYSDLVRRSSLPCKHTPLSFPSHSSIERTINRTNDQSNERTKKIT